MIPEFENKKDFVQWLNAQPLSSLIKIKEKLDDLYYNTAESTLPDEYYDILKEKVITLGGKVQVGAKLRTGDNRVNLPYWLGSADKITPDHPEVLDRFLKKNPAKDFIISEKLDGVSCLLVSDGKNIKLYTRGDGIVGADISYLSKYLHLPKNLPSISIRGELIMEKSIFQDKYSTEYKNARNMVSGLVGSKTARKGLGDISFIVYEIVKDSAEKINDQLNTLETLGFHVVKHNLISRKNINILNLEKILLSFKKDSLYDIDGIMVTSNTPYDRNVDGNPDYSFAFKVNMESDMRISTVREVEWNVSKWGVMKPVIIIDPVEMNGVTITRATAHNAGYVRDTNLGIGSEVKIIRSKDVIPYIVEVTKSTKAEFPKLEYTWDATNVNISIKPDETTEGKQLQNNMCVKLLSDFFSKMGIKFVSEATVEKLILGGLNNLLKIISAPKSALLKIFQEKTAERIHTNISQGLKNVKLSLFLGATCVLGYGISEKRVDALFLSIPDLLERKTVTLEDITSVEGFSDITGKKILKNLKYAKLLLQKVKGLVTFKEVNRTGTDLVGHKYVMTGFRDKPLEAEISSRGGKVTTSVSKNTTGLIYSGDTSSSKFVKAKELGVKIYTREEFEKFFRK